MVQVRKKSREIAKEKKKGRGEMGTCEKRGHLFVLYTGVLFVTHQIAKTKEKLSRI